jgi:hypothetical protein
MESARFSQRLGYIGRMVLRDGTWTRRVTVFKNGTWRTLVDKSWVAEERFRQARFELVGGPTVLVSAADLRQACDASKIRSEVMYSILFDLEKGTINDQPVHLQTET